MESLVSTKMAIAWLLGSRGHPTIPRGLRTRLYGRLLASGAWSFWDSGRWDDKGWPFTKDPFLCIVKIANNNVTGRPRPRPQKKEKQQTLHRPA